MPEIPKNIFMEDNLKPDHGEGSTGVEPRDQLPQVSCGKDNRKERAAKDKGGTMGVLFHNEVTHPEMHRLETEQAKIQGFPGMGKGGGQGQWG